MEKYRLTILRRAAADISEIYEYIKTDNEPAALNVFNMVSERIAALAAHPFQGAHLDKDDSAVKDFRFVNVKPYLIFYKIIGSDVIVYHVIDGRRDYWKILIE